jgi:integrase
LLRTLPDGSKNFYYRYFAAGARRFVLVGPFDPKGQRLWRGVRGDRLTLRAAQEGARSLADLIAQHGDIDAYEAERQRDAEQAQRAAEREARKGSFDQLLTTYTEQLHASGKASARSVENALNLHVRQAFPELLRRKAQALEPGDVQLILARMVQLGKTRQVNKVRSYLHAAFAYGGKHDNDPRRLAANSVVFALHTNPAVLVPRIAEFDRAGDRVLTPDELRLFWQELERISPVPAVFLRFNLALGGQRITQLLCADWTDYDFDQRVLTLKDGKGRPGVGVRDHLVPLTDWALLQLAPLRELNAGASSPFASVGAIRMDVTTPSKMVQRISAKLTAECGLPPFRAGDLRRSCETLLAGLGVSMEIRAQLLSHGRSSGVQAKHYDRYAYLPEKKVALETWAAFLRELA